MSSNSAYNRRQKNQKSALHYSVYLIFFSRNLNEKIFFGEGGDIGKKGGRGEFVISLVFKVIN